MCVCVCVCVCVCERERGGRIGMSQNNLSSFFFGILIFTILISYQHISEPSLEVINKSFFFVPNSIDMIKNYFENILLALKREGFSLCVAIKVSFHNVFQKSVSHKELCMLQLIMNSLFCEFYDQK